MTCRIPAFWSDHSRGDASVLAGHPTSPHDCVEQSIFDWKKAQSRLTCGCQDHFSSRRKCSTCDSRLHLSFPESRSDMVCQDARFRFRSAGEALNMSSFSGRFCLKGKLFWEEEERREGHDTGMLGFLGKDIEGGVFVFVSR
jgi:hypothetical protein